MRIWLKTISIEIADPKEKSSIWANQQMINSPTHYNDEYKMTANKQNQSQLSKGLARQLGTNLRGDDAYNGMNQIYKHATSFNRLITASPAPLDWPPTSTSTSRKSSHTVTSKLANNQINTNRWRVDWVEQRNTSKNDTHLQEQIQVLHILFDP